MSIDSTSFFSYVYSSWLTKYFWKAYRKGITLSDLPSISPLDSCSYNIRKLENLWNEELRHRGPTSASLPLVAWRFVRFRVIISCILNSASQIVRFILQTLFLRKLLEYSENPDRNFFDGLHWVLCILVFDIFQTVLYTWSSIMNQRTALRLKSACLSLLFKKVVNANSSEQKSSSELVNILSKDGHIIYNGIGFGVLILNGPIVTICTVICISMLLSLSALLGVILFLVFYIGQMWLIRLTNYCTEHAGKFTISRIQKTVEALDCIKQIKIYGWEQYFIQNISNIRSKESKWLWKLSYVLSLNSAIAHALPIVATIITFYMHSTVSNNLTASIVFPICIVIIVQMHEAFISMQTSLSHLNETLVIFDKIKSGLLLEDTSCHVMKPYEPSQALAIVNGCFACEIHKKHSMESEITENSKGNTMDEENTSVSEKQRLSPTPKPTARRRIEILSNITLKARKGQLIGISGRSNSGKSALLLAALGQIRMTTGQLMRQGGCAYVAQRAWLVNGSSIRDNILFGEAYDAKRYFEAQVVCKLRKEIKALAEGDETRVGQEGIDVLESFNQRIALARAFYADRDIYFLDDCLCSMENKVALDIFEDLILTALGGKTILFVTRELRYLNRCDYIYIMNDGKIAEHGRHKELMRLGKEYTSMVKAAIDDAEGDYTNDLTEAQNNGLVTYVENLEENKVIAKMCKKNEQIKLDLQGENDKSNSESADEPVKILTTTYYTYVRSLHSFLMLASIVAVYFIYAAVGVLSLLRLTWWVEAIHEKQTESPLNDTIVEPGNEDVFSFYRKWYGSCSFLVVLGCIVQSFVIQFATTKIANNVHNTLLMKLINAPLKFFDLVPVSRIRNLLSQDLSNVSLSLPFQLDNALRYMAICFCTFFVLISTIPWLTHYVVLTTICFILVGKIYKASQINLNSLESTLVLHINRFLQNSFQGLSTIRTFKKELDLLSKFQELTDCNSACCFVKNLSDNWLSTRLNLLTTSCLCVAAILVVIMKEDISPVIAGLTFVYIWQVPHVIQMSMRYFFRTESSFISVQNICKYLQLLTNDIDESVEYFIPDSQWPTQGLIDFNNVELECYKCENPTLDYMSFTIRDGEKIGILDLEIEPGKSCIVSALCKLYKLNKGTICIDSLDLSQIDSKLLRNRISIIPQDPIIYGTIRLFLDPTKCHDDSEIWSVLEKVHLKIKISGLDSQLYYSLDRETFNVHEKQLFFVAKALLLNNKIIIWEESAVSNQESAVLVHQILEKEFFHNTVLMVAHRLQTILPSDRVLVMSNGQVLEFDRPSILLANRKSYLYKLLLTKDEEEDGKIVIYKMRN